MHIKDTSGKIFSCYKDGKFDLELWSNYMDENLPNLKEMILEDIKPSLDSGLNFEKDYLPVLNAVVLEKEALKTLIQSFNRVTDDLEDRVKKNFHRSINAKIILYLGLCNGAGWVMEYEDKSLLLLGIEKIIELKWNDISSMTGLIYHELGHIYQSIYGVLNRDFEKNSERFLWQLFTEGIAMVFEQILVGDFNYFHQDKDGWADWCKDNLGEILVSFKKDLPNMSFENQRYFGDWVEFQGRPDTGYYLGADFVRKILDEDGFDNIINYDIGKVEECFHRIYNL